MRRGDGGDDGDVRAHDERQRGEFARMVHPHFEHTEIGGRWHTREAQRHADMIVVAFDRAVRLAGTEAIERDEQRLLRPRLARRAGDADDAAMAARARRDAERVQRGGAVGDADVRMVDWCRSEAHTSELQSLMRNSYAVLCLKKK